MLYYDEYGKENEEIIVLLSGAGVLDTFYHFYALDKVYHLVVPHLPGTGVNASKVYDPEKTTKDLIELIESFNTKVGIIGHSLGGQLTLRLLDKRGDLFKYAVILSAEVIADKRMIKLYTSMASLQTSLMKMDWLVKLQCVYWGFPIDVARKMCKYLKNSTKEVYASYFERTLELKELDYQNIKVPMMAICGKSELKSMKDSLKLLSKNENCKTMMIKGSHDFVMRNHKELLKIIIEYIKEH